MTYEEYIQTKQKEVNELPLFFAFSNKQLDEALAERNATRNDIYSLGFGGGFYLKKDRDIIHAFFSKKDLLPDLMKDEHFAEGAFYYEMCNHEYGINWQADWDVCSCFSKKELVYEDDKGWREYLDEAGLGDCKLAFSKARRRYFSDAEKNDWI